MSLKNVLTLCFCLIYSLLLPAQSGSPGSPLKVVLADESIALPGFSFVDYGYEPALLLSSEYPMGRSGYDGFYISGTLGWYFHRHFRTSVFTNAQISYRLRAKRFHGSIGVGPGAALAYATQPVYEFDDGTYAEGKNSGQLLFMPAATLELGYKLGTTPTATELLLDYSFAVETPFALVPAPHLFVGLGLRFYPFANH